LCWSYQRTNYNNSSNAKQVQHEEKGSYTGIIEKDSSRKFFLVSISYQLVEKNFKLGDEINIKTGQLQILDKSYNQYLKNLNYFS
jgi:hypothetical protein